MVKNDYKRSIVCGSLFVTVGVVVLATCENVQDDRWTDPYNVFFSPAFIIGAIFLQAGVVLLIVSGRHAYMDYLHAIDGSADTTTLNSVQQIQQLLDPPPPYETELPNEEEYRSLDSYPPPPYQNETFRSETDESHDNSPPPPYQSDVPNSNEESHKNINGHFSFPSQYNLSIDESHIYCNTPPHYVCQREFYCEEPYIKIYSCSSSRDIVPPRQPHSKIFQCFYTKKNNYATEENSINTKTVHFPYLSKSYSSTNTSIIYPISNYLNFAKNFFLICPLDSSKSEIAHCP